jgi:hypothetical protein
VSGRTIVAIFPRGEAIRNFAYTGALETLQSHGRCAVLSVKPNEEIWRILEGQCWALSPLNEFPERYPVRLLRDLLDMAHGRWLWSEAAQERWRLRDHEAVTLEQKLKRATMKLATAPFGNRVGLNVLSRTERIASRWFSTTSHYLDLFRKWQPGLVFNGSHVHSRNAIQAVEAAQWLGIPTAAFIFSWDNLTSQGRVLPPYDYYLVWNDALKRQLLDIYPFIAPDRVFVTGTPQFDPHFQPANYWSREDFCARVGADPHRPIVMYATGMPNHMPGEHLIVEQLADVLREMTAFGPPQLLVRVYAKDRSGRFEPLRKARPDILFPHVAWEANWLTPLPEDLPHWTNLVRHSDLGVNVASTVSLELCMFDRPVINIGYNPPGIPASQLEYARYYDFDHYSPVVASGAVRVAKNPVELRRFIEDALADPKAQSENRRALISRMFGDTLDGQSSARTASVLLDLAGR